MLKLMMNTKDKYHGARCVIAAWLFWWYPAQIFFQVLSFFNRHHCYCTSYFTMGNANLMCNGSGNGIPSSCFYVHFSVLHHKRLTETINVICPKFSCSLETFVDLWEKHEIGRWKHICQISLPNCTLPEQLYYILFCFPLVTSISTFDYSHVMLHCLEHHVPTRLV